MLPASEVGMVPAAESDEVCSVGFLEEGLFFFFSGSRRVQGSQARIGERRLPFFSADECSAGRRIQQDAWLSYFRAEFRQSSRRSRSLTLSFRTTRRGSLTSRLFHLLAWRTLSVFDRCSSRRGSASYRTASVGVERT